MSPDILTVSDAAAALGITPRGVRWLIEVGKLPAVRVGRDWGVFARDVESEKRRRERRRRKSKMKRIVDGKRYDTETAELVDSWESGHNRGDFHRCEETLYRTKKGSWFLHGEGGPLSSYGRAVGNERHGGEVLRPLTPEEAIEWLEEKGDPEILERHFSNAVEDA